MTSMVNSTGGTVAIELELVVNYLKAVEPGYLVRARFDLVIGKFNNFPTAKANEVVVVFTLEFYRFIPRSSVAKVSLEGQATFLEQLQGSINGGISDSRVLLFYLFVKVFDRHVLSQIVEEFIKYHVSLLSGFEPFFGDEFF